MPGLFLNHVKVAEESGGEVTVPGTVNHESLKVGGIDVINSTGTISNPVMPSGTTAQRESNPTIGYLRYNTDINAVEMYVGQLQWLVVQYRYKWTYPRDSNINNGIISPDGQKWWGNGQITSAYGGVILNRVFPGDFTAVASWEQDFRGVGMVYRDNASLDDFTGDGGNGPYWGAIGQSGFSPASPSYTALAQYYAPITGDTATTFYYFKWQRSGNILTLQYSATSATGPWTNFNTSYTATCSTSNEVIIGAGEADSGEIKPLTLISVIES
tara:strand:- start:6591 stop:7403 length:813 start_codon:yes stop_codon:yes gene_type:complete